MNKQISKIFGKLLTRLRLVRNKPRATESNRFDSNLCRPVSVHGAESERECRERKKVAVPAFTSAIKYNISGERIAFPVAQHGASPFSLAPGGRISFLRWSNAITRGSPRARFA